VCVCVCVCVCLCVCEKERKRELAVNHAFHSSLHLRAKVCTVYANKVRARRAVCLRTSSVKTPGFYGFLCVRCTCIGASAAAVFAAVSFFSQLFVEM